jgi:hypothetical protein
VTFESGFEDTERAAGVATKSAAALVSALKQLQKAAADGELGALHKAAERVMAAVKPVCQEVENAVAAWPFSPDAEERYLREAYVDELLGTAQAEGVPVQRLDDGYLLHPSVLRILPAERSVTIDRKRVPVVRPSRLLRKLKVIQSAKPMIGSEQFLELLHRAYRLLAEKQYGRTISLAAIYETLTLMPGSAASYGQTEFARDLFLLDRSGVTKTKAGATISLPASTGTKGARGTFSFVSPDGEPVTYYGIRFLEGSE